MPGGGLVGESPPIPLGAKGARINELTRVNSFGPHAVAAKGATSKHVRTSAPSASNPGITGQYPAG